MRYSENFESGAGGWYTWIDNARGPRSLEIIESSALSRSPWWIDYNHAPPGAGYLHLLYMLNTTGKHGEHMREIAGENRFTAGQFPTDFRNANVTLKLRGELDHRGAQLVLLCQAYHQDVCSGWMLTSQPIPVTNQWQEHTINVAVDPEQWTCLGSRQGREDYYGQWPLESVLADVNADILLVLFPLDVVPMGPQPVDPHALRAERDYPVWRSKLPEGYVMLDRISIDFAV